jgi:voltage-gated potassium channel
VCEGRIRRRVYDLLEVVNPDDVAGLVVKKALLALIVLNVLGMVLGTVASIRAAVGPALRAFDVASVLVFTVEYVLRIWSASAGGYRGFGGRLRFALRPYMVFDLLAIAPFWIPFVGVDLRVLRIVRIFRVFRILRVARYSQALQTFGRVLLRTKEQLAVTFGFGFIVLLIAATLLHYAEGHLQPEHFGSIPQAMWWGVVTLTTVGYGDAFPVTLVGKILASIIAIVGIGMFAMPAGILGSAFVAEYGDGRAEDRTE